MGTEEFWVPAVLAAVGTGASYVNQANATKRADTSEAQAIADQQNIRQKGVQNVNQTVSKIAADNPNALAAKATGSYVDQLRRNAAGSTQGGPTTGAPQTFGASTSSLAPGVVGGSRYKSDTANAQREVQSYGNTEASQMADLDAAVRMRQNEGLAMQTLGTNLNTLGASSYAQNFVDQLRAQTAGQPNPWVGLGASLFGNAANFLSKNWQPGTPSTPGSSAPQAVNLSGGGGSQWA